MSLQADSIGVVPGLLSVVVPIGAVNDWLLESVKSALDQKEVELEVLAVFNNGAEMPEDWPPAKDPRVRVLHFSEPLGSGGAGQAGIDAARGEFFVRLDADDVMKPGRLRKQLDWLQAHESAVLVSSRVNWINGDGALVGAFQNPTGADVRRQLLKLNVCPHSSWMARISTVRDVGGYDPAQDQMDDYDLLLRIATKGEIAVLPETLTDYRLHDNQMSRAVKPWGHYIRVIRKRRAELGHALGLRWSRVASARLWWEWQQWLMYLGRKVKR